jgi:hypothetical protein
MPQVQRGATEGERQMQHAQVYEVCECVLLSMRAGDNARRGQGTLREF